MMLFSDKLVTDDRDPVQLIEDLFGYRVSVMPIKISFHVQIVTLVLLQIAISNLLAIVTYYGVVIPVKREREASTSAFLAAFGFIIPVSLLLPFYGINALDIRSVTLRFGCILIPMLVPLKCLDALFGVDSEDRRLRTSSLQHYMYYMGFVLLPIFSKRSHKSNPEERAVVPLSRRSFVQTCIRFHFWFFMTMVVFQILIPFNFRPFPEKERDRTTATDLFPTFDLARMFNGYAQVIAFFLTLIFSMNGVTMICSLAGNLQVIGSIFDSHLFFASSSPSDFWGKRWNSLIHHVLKEGIYKPMRAWTGDSSHSKAMAVLVTFLTSGLIHEYVWALLFFDTDKEAAEDNCQTCYHPVIGKHLVFFGWNGILIVLEKTNLVRTISGSALAQFLPALIRTQLLAFLGVLPVAHLVTEDLLESGYFKQLELAMPLLRFENVSLIE